MEDGDESSAYATAATVDAGGGAADSSVVVVEPAPAPAVVGPAPQGLAEPPPVRADTAVSGSAGGQARDGGAEAIRGAVGQVAAPAVGGISADTEVVEEYSRDEDGAAAAGGGAEGKQEGEAEVSERQFFEHGRHVFVLSAAGKPIYSRYGEESRLATLMPMVCAIIDQYDDLGGSGIQCIIAGELRFVFYRRDPLYLLGITQQSDPPELVTRQLEYVYDQIVSLVTSGHIDALRKNPKRDIRHLIDGAEHVVHQLIDDMDSSPCFLLNCWSCLPMDPALRREITAAIQSQRCPEILYGLMVAPRSQVVTLVEPRKASLHPTDLLLLINYVHANSERFQTETSNFTHTCLPMANDRSWHHVYIYFMMEGVALIWVTGQVEAFQRLRAAQEAVTARLIETGLMDELRDCVSVRAAPPFLIRSLGMTADFWHFMFKMTSRNQLTCPEFDGVYRTAAARRRLFRDYQHLHTKMLVREQAQPTPPGKARACFFVTQHHSIFVYLTSEFEFCAAYSPLVRKEHAMEVAIYLVNDWMYREREKLFLLETQSW